MDEIMFFLFAIPVLSFIIIAVYQFISETFKKKFVLERRRATSSDQVGGPRRRYSDSVPPGTLRNPELTSAKATEVSAPQAHGA